VKAARPVRAGGRWKRTYNRHLATGLPVHHIAVLDAALAQLPDAHRHGTPILVRADTAGCTREFLAHLRGLRDTAVSCSFSVGWAITGKERSAIGAIPARVWADAIDADGGHREGAGLAEITGVLSGRSLAGYPAGTRVIVRRERPHPGAQLDAFEEADGWRYTAFATDTRVGQLARLDARHRAHARVEDRIRCAKDTGLDHFPSRSFAINQAWLSVVMLAVAHPRTASPLVTHPAHLALGSRPRSSLRPARGTARPGWLIVDPDTTSGGSHRQNQHAGRLTMSILRNDTPAKRGHDHKIDCRPS
jgi:hypothetical protein